MKCSEECFSSFGYKQKSTVFMLHNTHICIIILLSVTLNCMQAQIVFMVFILAKSPLLL